MAIKLKNNVVGYLATAINASDTGIALNAGDGAAFPTLGVSDYFYATLVSSGGTLEVIKVTARSGDSLTVVRAQEGSSAQSFAAGSRLEMRVTAQSVLDATSALVAANVSIADAGGYYSATNVEGALQEIVNANTSKYIPKTSAYGTVTRSVRDKESDWVSVLDFGAIPDWNGSTGTDNSVAIQAAIDSGKHILFPKGDLFGGYMVTNVKFRTAGGRYRFASSYIVGNPSASGVVAPVEITAYYQIFYDLEVTLAYQTNYEACIWWHKYAAEAWYPEFIHIYGLVTDACKIGILYGDTGAPGRAPVDAPVSENHIFGWRTRGCERPIFYNQPNGFLTVTGSTLVVQPNEWPLYNPGVWNDSVSACIEVVVGALMISNSYLIKNTTFSGYAMICGSPGTTSPYTALVYLNNCVNEIACSNFFLGQNSRTFVNNVSNNYWNPDSVPFIDVQSSGTIKFHANGLHFGSHPGYAATGIVRSSNPDADLVFINSRFDQQVKTSILDSVTAPYWSKAKVTFTDCRLSDSSGDYTLDFAKDNRAWYYAVYPDISRYDVTAGAGTFAAVVAASHPIYKKALQLTGASGQDCFATTKVNIDQAIRIDGRPFVLELTMQVLAGTTQFYGNIAVIYYDDAGTFLGSTQIDDGTVADLTSTAGAQAWRTVRKIVSCDANAAQVALRFGVKNYAQVWQIAGIKVY